MNTMTTTNGENMFVIPDQMPVYKDMFDTNVFLDREKYIKEGMYAFVSWKWVNPFADWIDNRKCLEVMAGRGILTCTLRQKGINIVATDDFSWAEKESEQFKKWSNTMTEVKRMDAVVAVEKYGKSIDILIMSWPYMDNTAYRVIKKLHEVNPFAKVVYIGEDCGGCTANEDFFKHFKTIEDKSFEPVVENFERWFGLHDYPQLGKFSK